MTETEEDLQRYIDREQNPLVIGLARALLVARSTIATLRAERDALREAAMAACKALRGYRRVVALLALEDVLDALSTPPTTEETRDE